MCHYPLPSLSFTPKHLHHLKGFPGLRGLNAYAELIAGPGQYTFRSGTAGGGFVIRPERPTETELASLPLEVQNALRYAQNKEQLNGTIMKDMKLIDMIDN